MTDSIKSFDDWNNIFLSTIEESGEYKLFLPKIIDWLSSIKRQEKTSEPLDEASISTFLQMTLPISIEKLLNFGEIEDQKEIELLLIFFQKVIELIPSIQNNLNIELVNSISKLFDAETKIFQKNSSTRFFTKIFNFFASQQNDLIDVIKSMNPAENINYCYYNCLMLRIYYNIKQNKRRDKKTDLFTHSIVNFFIQFIQTNISNFHFFSDKKNFEVFTNAFNAFLNLLDDNEIPNLYCFLLENLLNESIKVQKFICGCLSKLCKIPKYAKVIHKIEFESPKIINLLLSNTFCPKVLVEFEQFIQFLIEEGMTDKNFIINFWKIYHESELFDANETYIDLIVYSLKFIEFESFDEFIDFVQKFPNFYHFLAKIVFKFQNYDEKEEITILSLKNLLNSSFTNEIAGKELLSLINQKLDDSLIKNILPELFQNLINEDTIDISCLIMDSIITSSSDPLNIFDYDQLFELINENNENAIIHILIQFHLKSSSVLSNKLITLLHNKQEIVDDTWNLLKNLLANNTYQYAKDFNKLLELAKKQNLKNASLSFIKFLKILIFKYSNKYFLDTNKKYPIKDLHCQFRILKNSIIGLDIILNAYLENENENNILSARNFLLKVFDGWSYNSVNFLNRQFDGKEASKEKLKRFFQLILELLQNEISDPEDLDLPRHLYPNNYLQLNIKIKNCFSIAKNYFIHFDQEKSLKSLKERISKIEETRNDLIFFDDFPLSQENKSLVECGIKNNKEVKVKIISIEKTSNFEKQLPLSYYFSQIHFEDKLLTLLDGNEFGINSIIWQILQLLPTSKSIKNLIIDSSEKFNKMIMETENNYKKLYILQTFSKDNDIFDNQDSMNLIIDLFQENYLKLPIISTLNSAYKTFHKFNQCQDISLLLIQYLNQVECEDYILIILELLTKMSMHNNFDFIMDDFEPFEKLNEKFYDLTADLFFRISKNNQLNNKLIEYCKSKIINDFDNSRLALKIINLIYKFTDESQINPIYDYVIRKFQNYIDIFNEKRSLSQLIYISDIFQFLSKIISKFPSLIKGKGFPINYLMNIAFNSKFKENQKFILNILSQYLKIEKDQKIKAEIISNMKELIDNSNSVCNYDPSIYSNIESYTGLTNLGSTCYINSVFQQFFHLFPVRYLLSTSKFKKQKGLKSIQKIMIKMAYTARPFIDTSEFIKQWKGWKNELIDPKKQQDSMEFYQYLVDSFPKQIKDLFNGEMVNYINNDISMNESFYSINIPVANYDDIYSSFEDYNSFNEEIISSKIKKLPPVLVIQLQRFSYENNTLKKINNVFEFPIDLDMEQMCIKEKDQNQDEFHYKLNGIIIHKGVASSGHFISLIRKADNWWCFNDNKVSKIDTTDVKELSFGRKENGTSAYILFYTQVLDVEIKRNKKISFYEEFNYQNEIKNLVTILNDNDVYEANRALYLNYVNDFVQSIEDPLLIIEFFFKIFCHSIDHSRCNSLVSNMKKIIKEEINSIDSSSLLLECADYLIDNFDDILDTFLNCSDKNLVSNLSSFILFFFNYLDKIMSLPEKLILIDDDDELDKISSPSHEKSLIFFKKLGEQIITKTNSIEKISKILNLINPYISNHIKESFKDGWSERLIKIINIMYGTTIYKTDFSKLNVSNILNTLNSLLLNYHDPESDEVVDLLKYGTEIKSSESNVKSYENLINESIIPIINQINENKEFYEIEMISPRNYLLLLENLFNFPKYSDEQKYSLLIFQKTKEILIFVGKCQRTSCDILLKAKVSPYKAPVLVSNDEETTLTELVLPDEESYVYCITIPEIGEVLVAQNGNVLLNHLETSCDFYLKTDDSVVINSGKLDNLYINTANVIISNESDSPTLIKSLNIKYNDMPSKLFISENSILDMGSIDLKNSLIVNFGTLMINNNSLYNSSIINNGKIIAESLDNLRFILNTRLGTIHSEKYLQIQATNIYNYGEIDSEKLNIIADETISNHNNIKIKLQISVFSEFVENYGLINAFSGVFLGSKFRQFSKGQIHINDITFYNLNVECEGSFKIKTLTFSNNQINDSNFSKNIASFDNSHFSYYYDLHVKKGCEIMFGEKNKLGEINKLNNQGNLIIKAEISYILNLENELSGKLLFMRKTSIKLIENKGHIVVLGESNESAGGSLYIKNDCKYDKKFSKSSESKCTLFIYDKYNGLKDSTLEIANGGIIYAYGYESQGLTFCHNYFNINTEKNKCCYGLVASQDGITLSLQGKYESLYFSKYESLYFSKYGTLDLSKKIIEPMIEGGKKIFNVISPYKIEIHDDFNRNVDITLKTRNFLNYSKLIANNIKIESSSFTNKGQISSSNDIEINCKDFYNISGRIEAHKKIDIEAEESFENCGGGKIQKSITEYIKVHETEKCEKYIDRNVGLYGTESRIRIKETSQKITKYIYYPQLEKSGVIATDNGSLKIHSRCINNSFGIMNAKKGILLDGNESIENKCGLIYSGYFLQISSKKFRNGFCENPQTITNYNPEKPKISKIKFIGYIHPLLSYIEPPVYVVEPKNCDPYIYDYERNDLKIGGSKYPGYLFAQDNIKILSETDVYLGTIVSGKNISIRGRNTSSQSSDDIGTIVANGNVFMEMERASLNHARIQAENITIKLLEDLTIEGIIQPIVLLDGSVVCILDLNKFAQIIGILSKNPSMAQKFIKYTESSLKETGMSGFIGKYPTTEKFLSSLPDKQMEELAKLFLAPIHGRKILQNQNLVRSLEYSGAKSTNASKAINYAGDKLDLVDNAMIVYQKSDEKQTIIGENGEKEIVSVFNPQLVFSSMCKISSLIGAAKKASIETMKSIKINPGNFTPESDLSLKAGEKISILSQYKYNEKGERINPVNIISKNELTLSGDKGVETKGVNISSKKLNIISSHGDVIDNGVTMSYKSIDSYDKISYEKRSTCTSNFCAQDSVLIKGNNIKLNGTNISSGNGGIKFSAENVELRPSYETFNCEKKTKRTKFIHQEKIVIPQSIVTTGIIDFDARNVNMFSPYIVANKIRNNCEGDFNILADRNYLYRYNYYKKRRFLGSCVKEQTQINNIVKPAEIIAKEIESLGVGTVKIEGVIMKSINMIITKNFIEKTAYDEFFYKEKNRRRGFFAPKIKGDPMKDSIKSLRGSTGGDVASHGLSLASTAFQTCSHIKTLTHLSSLPNPMIQLSSILLSRFTTCALYCDMKQTTKVTEKVPIQSNVEVGFFYLKNDRTHLEGIWNIDKATIETNLLTAESPKKTIEIENHSKSFCIEFNVAGILSSLVIPCSTVTKLLVKLPAVGNSEAKSSEKAESNFPMQLNAEAIFIRCNNAVFSGSQIRSKLIDIIVEKKLTIESLTNLFDSKSQSSCFKVAVYSLFNSVSNETLSSSVFGKSLQKIPMIRIANKSIMSEKVDAIAQLVGTERFYLKVGELLYTNPSLIGLISEGKFVETENEQIFINEAQSVKINEIYKEKSSVINPSVNEMFSLMGQIDDYKRIYSNTMKNAMSKSSAISEVNNEISSYLNNKETQKSYLQMKDDLKELNESIEKVSEILYEENLPHDIIDNKYQKASEMVENYIHKSLNSVSVLCSKNEKFLQKNSKMERIYNYSISSMLHNSIDQILKVPMIFCKESLSKYQTKFSSICQSKKMVANLIEEMPEKIVDYAMSFGSNEDEARDFSNAMILGMKNIIKEKNDISENINYPNLLKNKLEKIEENNLVNLKENYSNIEKLRCESQQALCEFVEKETLKRMKFTPPDLFYN